MSVTVRAFVLIVRTLEFQRRMGYLKLLFQPILDRTANTFNVVPTVPRNNNMGIERRSMLFHLPKMSVVYFFDAIHSFDGGNNVVGVYIRWAAQH